MKRYLEYQLVSFSKYTITVSDALSVLFLFVATGLFLWFLRSVLNRLQARGRIDAGRKAAVYQITKYVLLTVVLMLSLESLGFKLSILLAGSAALLVGIGFGLQETFRDFVSGIILLLEGNLQVGDVLEVGGVVGRVTTISIRTSTLVTRDGVYIIVPNHKFVSENVINWSHNRQPTRFTVTVRVSYKSDTELVRKVLYSAVAELVDGIKENERYKPLVRLGDFADSGLYFEVLFWSYEHFRFENVKSELRFIIARKFKEHHIEIPFPQRDLHIKNGNLPNGV